MDRLDVMKAFCRIVERGSFARAAEDMGVSPALLSRETRLLEESLGCTLLTRTTRSMSLTDHGRHYYDEARRILHDIGAMEDRLRRGAETVKGRLRVNAPVSWGLSVLSPLLPPFLRRHPDLTLALTLEDRVLDMVEGGFDLSLRLRAELPDSGLFARRIGGIRQRLFAAPFYLDARGRPGAVADLRGHDHVAFEHADHAQKWTLIGPGGTEELPLEPRLRLGSSLFLRDMLAAGMGVGALPDFIADPEVAAGRLERVLPEHELPPRQIFAVTASRLGTDAKTAAFLDHLQDALRDPR
ncbi:LysR family transcriptional regulator [Actibacterium sp. MT2.3-13A]|uniref:LysR family transcriptional regulator n=1 Tax=Actibacterium sp. MT2.3-13A TaxID=2828332 RepID=UPI001BA45476|nr:LysR family transcriptional regulator [Actibacterium sp. MT2.3-13A]